MKVTYLYEETQTKTTSPQNTLNRFSPVLSTLWRKAAKNKLEKAAQSTQKQSTIMSAENLRCVPVFIVVAL